MGGVGVRGDFYARYARWIMLESSWGVVDLGYCTNIYRDKFDSKSLEDECFFFNLYEACLLLQTLHDDCISEFILLSNTKGWTKYWSVLHPTCMPRLLLCDDKEFGVCEPVGDQLIQAYHLCTCSSLRHSALFVRGQLFDSVRFCLVAIVP